MSETISKRFELNSEYIELYKILKLEGLANSGGSAKLFISDGLVTVNGIIETRKRRKIVAGDLIEFDSSKIVVVKP